MENEGILEKLERADMVLVGLGEDFDKPRFLEQDERYLSGCEWLNKVGLHWLMPAWNGFCAEKSGDAAFAQAFEGLADLLRGKNHFVVSVSTDKRAGDLGRSVMPCGSSERKQCGNGCKGMVEAVTEQDEAGMVRFLEELYHGRPQETAFSLSGNCPECGGRFVLNNIYAENYNEEGYLQQWTLYMKWLQGTLNRRLLVLELGVGMRFPSIIRWPFEKIAFFNQKAYFCRVHEKLYQLTKELSEKGCGISKNAIDWLREL